MYLIKKKANLSIYIFLGKLKGKNEQGKGIKNYSGQKRYLGLMSYPLFGRGYSAWCTDVRRHFFFWGGVIKVKLGG